MNNEVSGLWKAAPVCGAGEYVQALLEGALISQRMGNADIELVQKNLSMLFHARTLRKLAGDSDSMRVEMAREIANGTLYTLGLYLKEMLSAEEAVAALCGGDLNDLYLKGRQLLERQTKTAFRLWRAVRNTALPTPHIGYRETLMEGMGAFFKGYDMDFFPHETPGDIDYPLAMPLENRTGVEYVRGWLERMLAENRFCQRFAPEKVHGVMQRGHIAYAVLLVNIFEPVLLCALGAQLSRNDVLELAPLESGMGLLEREAKGSAEGAKIFLEQGAEELCAALDVEKDDALYRYLCDVAKRNAAACYAAAKTGNLSRFFYAVKSA